jgi:AmmeMemoRadiSam system protein A
MRESLSARHREHLLTVARDSIASVLDGRRLEVRLDGAEPPLTRPSGAFVTLHTDGRELRGCIGSVHAVAPLLISVADNAVNAAFRDPRFHPLRQEELPLVSIEISVMSPLERVTQIDEIVVGRDGLIVTRGHRAGLLLPQVATEYGWSLEEFLRHTCLKAGLPPDAWHSPECVIQRFSAEVFGELND